MWKPHDDPVAALFYGKPAAYFMVLPERFVAKPFDRHGTQVETYIETLRVGYIEL